MLELKDLELRVGTFALRASCDVDPASRIAVIGPSGSGKSTLLMALAGFLKPFAGNMIWQGVDITKTDPSARPFSVLFQDNNLFPHMSVAQNVGLGLRPSLQLSSEEAVKVDDALTAVGLTGVGGRKPAELSGGQQSRAALARVLVQSKPMILLDEPFAALGPALKIEMLDLVSDLCAETGAGLLMVSHDPEDAKRICDSTILVADGIAHAPTATDDLLSDPPEALRAYLGK
ncbi:ATP-binding cassette domain-containing protein [Planktotalea frisia]|jgi:thiamine transport system ATP-binding protein|uniref:thiamine ABC transporter ATP-binding protein n=1 Tax=Planktotalea frisia TaxID=696762 RepID=UPI002352F0F9|nr:ATP-binding cassette domain-containing protein [Planktotalea frisia]